MKESAFRNAVHNKLPAAIHRQPMLAGEYGVAGTPDSYYDGIRDLWCEYKVIRSDDYLPSLVPTDSMPTAIQLKWLNRRYANGNNAIVMVGVKRDNRAWGFVLASPDEWTVRSARAWYEPRLMLARDLAMYIQTRVLLL